MSACADNQNSDLYDVVIVGAGVTGAMVAKTLADKGKDQVKRILILEAGEGTGMTAEGYNSYVDHYYNQTIKVPNAPYPKNDNAPSANVLDNSRIHGGPDTKGYLVQYGPLPFLSDYTRAAGGTSLHWLGTCLRMLPNDFRMQSAYSKAVDWPIDYHDLRPYYERAEREIGVAGDVSEQHYPGTGDDYFGPDYQFPMKKIPQSYLDQQIASSANGMKVPMPGQSEEIQLTLDSTPQGRNSTPNVDYDGGKGFTPIGMVGSPFTGQRCEGNSSCTPICPVQAKYNSLKTLNAVASSTLDIQVKSVASRVLIDADTGRVNGIEYKQYESADSPEYQLKIARGTKYVLAAHAIENAKLLLQSKIANASDQVGRNLMDHLCMMTWGLMPNNAGAYRGPGSTSGIASFRDGEFRKSACSFRVEIGNWGWNWPEGTPVSNVEHFVDTHNLFGAALRNRLVDELPRQFRIAWEPEQLPHQDNKVTIDDQYLDALGNHRPVIHYDVCNYTRAGLAQARKVSDQLFQQIGVEDHTTYKTTDPGYFTYEGTGYTANGAGHLVGTHRMGTNRMNSVVDKRQRCWDHDNLYLVGCGNMPTLGTSNPTLTAAALSIWAADNIIEDMRKGSSL